MSLSDRAFRLAALVSVLIGIAVLAYLGVLDKAATGGAVVLLIMAVIQVFRANDAQLTPTQPTTTQPTIPQGKKGPDGK